MLERQKVAALVAEFLGAGALTLLVLSVQRSTIGVPFFVAIAAGLTVALMTFTVGGISAGHFNPAISIGFWTTRRITTIRTICYVAAQMLGAWGAYYLYTYFVNNHLSAVGGHYSGRILVAEAVGTGIFGFAFAAAVYQESTKAAKAAFIGLGLTIGIIAASSASIGLLNPAVALGVRAWVWGTYVLGPVLGAIIGINLYAVLFAEASDSPLSAVLASAAGGSVTANTTASTTKKSTKKNKK
jgi:aquaporin Z